MNDSPKIHYFNEGVPDPYDIQLKMCIGQGYVPQGCLLAGAVVYHLVVTGKDPCKGCGGPREKCKGRPE